MGRGNPRAGKVAQAGRKDVARVLRAILRCLGEFGGAGAPSKLIAKRTGIPHRTVKRHLKNLVRDEVIRQDYPRGPYVARPGQPDLKTDPWGKEGIHGLVLVAKWPKTLLRIPGRGPGSDMKSSLPKVLSDMVYKAGTRWGESKRLWRNWWVTFRHYPGTDRIVAYVPSTKRPIPFPEFPSIQAWLEGVFDIEDAGSRFYVTQIGVQTDTEGWTLKGVKAVELRRFANALEQLYQKGKVLRHEVHLTPKDLTLAQAMAIIKDGSPTVRLEKMLKDELELERKRAERERPERPESFPPEPGRDSYQTGYG